MKKTAREIWDVHTHSLERQPNTRAIVNCALSVGDSLCAGETGNAEPSFDKLPFSLQHYYSVGIHPWELTAQNVEAQLVLLKTLVGDPRLLAIGEAGLDKLAAAPMELQISVFEKQVAFSEAQKKPLIVHCVKAMDELLAVQKKLKPQQSWIWHGFRGKTQQAELLLKRGFYLSFGEHYADEALRMVPAERLLLETDMSLLGIEQLLERATCVRGQDADALNKTIGENIEKLFFKR